MIYLERYAYPDKLVEEPVNPATKIIVTIPALRETQITRTLDSILNCSDPGCETEIIVFINAAKNCSASTRFINERALMELMDWISKSGSAFISFRVAMNNDLDPEEAGAGLARKIVMDDAVRRFSSISEDGIIVCLDADCLVSENYLQSIWNYYTENPDATGANLYFEHPIDPGPNRDAIIDYELHLRCLSLGLRNAGYPYYFHTVGSAMTVRSSVYQKQGGMNRRQAGEDFHFLHKVFPLGGYGVIPGATVYPSSRLSDRVPFGTGKAMISSKERKVLKTYNPRSYEGLTLLISKLEEIYEDPGRLQELPESTREGLNNTGFKKAFTESKSGTDSFPNFQKRFYGNYSGIKVIRFLHFLRDHYHPDVPVSQAAGELSGLAETDAYELLMAFRKTEREAAD